MRYDIVIKDYQFSVLHLDCHVQDILVFSLDDSVPGHAEHLLQGISRNPHSLRGKNILFESPLLSPDINTVFLYEVSCVGDLLICCAIFTDMKMTCHVKEQTTIHKPILSQRLIEFGRTEELYESSSDDDIPINDQYNNHHRLRSFSPFEVSSDDDSNSETNSRNYLNFKVVKKLNKDGYMPLNDENKMILSTNINNLTDPNQQCSKSINEIKIISSSRIIPKNNDHEVLEKSCRKHNDRQTRHIVDVEDFKFRPSSLVISQFDIILFRCKSSSGQHIFCEDLKLDFVLDRDGLRKSSFTFFEYIFNLHGDFELINKVFSFMVCKVTVESRSAIDVNFQEVSAAVNSDQQIINSSKIDNNIIFEQNNTSDKVSLRKKAKKLKYREKLKTRSNNEDTHLIPSNDNESSDIKETKYNEEISIEKQITTPVKCIKNDDEKSKLLISLLKTPSLSIDNCLEYDMEAFFTTRMNTLIQKLDEGLPDEMIPGGYRSPIIMYTSSFTISSSSLTNSSIGNNKMKQKTRKRP